MNTIKAYCKDFWRYRFLLQNLVTRDFKIKYRRSVLGVLWSVLNPLLMSMVMYVVFSTVFAAMRAGNIQNFAVYLIIGQLLFNFFSESTEAAMQSMIGAAQLIKKVYIPKYIFPLEKVCFALVNCLFSFIALAIVMLITGAPLHPTFLLALYPLFMLFIFNLGVGLALAALAVFFRDVIHLWSVFCTALMYFSAIFYDPTQMGSLKIWGLELNIGMLIRFNPLYWYITAFRTAVLDGKVLTLSMVLCCAGCALGALAVGLAVFRSKQDKFVLYI